MTGMTTAETRLILASIVLVMSLADCRAQEIYRCETDGKVGYTSNVAGKLYRKPVKFFNTNPSSAEVERALEEKVRKQAEEQSAADQAREEAKLNAEQRAARALEQEAGAAQRRAYAAEEQLRMMKEGQGNLGYQPYGGFYFGGRQAPRFAGPVPRPAGPPQVRPPQPLPSPNSGRVDGRHQYHVGGASSP